MKQKLTRIARWTDQPTWTDTVVRCIDSLNARTIDSARILRTRTLRYQRCLTVAARVTGRAQASCRAIARGCIHVANTIVETKGVRTQRLQCFTSESTCVERRSRDSCWTLTGLQLFSMDIDSVNYSFQDLHGTYPHSSRVQRCNR